MVFAVPVFYAYASMDMLDWQNATLIVAGSLGICFLLWSLRSFNYRPVVTVVLLLLAGSVFIRWLFLTLIQFSGSGFNAEFFQHANIKSIVVGWQLYGWWLLAAVFALVAVIVIGQALTYALPRTRTSVSVLLALSGFAMVGLSSPHVPETELAAAIYQLKLQSTDIPGYDELVARWQNSQLVSTKLTEKQNLTTRLPQNPKNLILVYLESIGTSVATHPEWPDLMPHLSRRIEENSLTKTLHGSAFITIEGIVNSQCGTLFPFDRGSDSMANGANLAERMPCLGDILEHAGYENIYMGGADLAFAGKGDFLRAHGYAHRYGLEHWRSLGIRQRPDTWGVSDADLFEQALQTILERQNETRPYNLTLLTIGTHIPGFVYAECADYPDSSEQFLSAIHCTDQLLNDWLERLDAMGLMENTLVVITADHNVFTSPPMRELFGDAVTDRRLPFVILGEQPKATVRDEGASYDLAPTILDLLAIEHNATFPLGRSLLSKQVRPDYYLSRNTETIAGETRNRRRSQCQDDQTPAPHIDAQPSSCQANDLDALLRRQIESLSSSSSIAIQCNARTPLSAHMDPALEPALSMAAGDTALIQRFTRKGRAIPVNQSGLYLAWFDRSGRLENLMFTRHNESPSQPPGSDITRAWLALWHLSDGETATPPDWLPASSGHSGAFFGENLDGEIRWQTLTDSEPIAWQLPSGTCRRLFDH
jgi:phosphoglycerol transferase MdoB-like AlkP superfamily enzyme